MPIWESVSSNVQRVWGSPTERRNTPSSVSSSARHSACHVIRLRLCPRAARLARENGSATPTRNENEGWIRSCSEHPIHSAWLCWWHRNFQKPLSGSARSEERRVGKECRSRWSPYH